MICYKFRLYPSKLQQELLWNDANNLNKLYNYFLNQRIVEYKQNNKSIKQSEQQKEIVILKDNKDWEFLANIHSQVRQTVTDRLEKSFNSFYKLNDSGYPKFRSCKNFFGIHYPQSGFNVNIKQSTVHTKRYGSIKFFQHDEISGKIKSIYIKCSDKNEWYVSITVDSEIKKVKNLNNIVGIDLGSVDLYITNNGFKLKNQDHSKYFDKQISKLQSRKDKNCKKNSRKSRHLSKVINKLYEAKKNKTNDFLHKASRTLSNQYDTIIIEDLNCKKMSESDCSILNKNNRNSCWGKFIGYLNYKTNRLIKVPPYHTTQCCNNCSTINKVDLKVRKIKCSSCKVEYDRDINAAMNIICLGQAILDGYKVSPTAKPKNQSIKSVLRKKPKEAPCL